MSEFYHPTPQGLNLQDLNPRRPAQFVSPHTQDMLKAEYGSDTVGIATTLIEKALATGNSSHLDHAVFALEAGDIPVAQQTRADLLLGYMPGFAALAEDRQPTPSELADIRSSTDAALHDAAMLLSLSDEHIAEIYAVGTDEAVQIRRIRQGDTGDGVVCGLSQHNAATGKGDLAYPSSRRQDSTLPYARVYRRLVLNAFSQPDPDNPDDQAVLGIKTRRGSHSQSRWDTPQYLLLPEGTNAILAATGQQGGTVQRPTVVELIDRIQSAEHKLGNEENIAVRDQLAASVQTALDASRLTKLPPQIDQ